MRNWTDKNDLDYKGRTLRPLGFQIYLVEDGHPTWCFNSLAEAQKQIDEWGPLSATPEQPQACKMPPASMCHTCKCWPCGGVITILQIQGDTTYINSCGNYRKTPRTKKPCNSGK